MTMNELVVKLEAWWPTRILMGEYAWTDKFIEILSQAKQENERAYVEQPFFMSDELVKAYLEKGMTQIWGRPIVPYEKAPNPPAQESSESLEQMIEAKGPAYKSRLRDTLDVSQMALDLIDAKEEIERLKEVANTPAQGDICIECGGNGYTLENSGMGEEQEPMKCIECDGKGLCYPAQELPAPKKCPYFGDNIQSGEGCPGSINTRHCPDNTDEDCNIIPLPQDSTPLRLLKRAYDGLQGLEDYPSIMSIIADIGKYLDENGEGK